MGAKKKGLANRLAKMSDEDRARYLQHRADMEEEARRRKEQLISIFLKNKLKKEEAFSRLNVAKLNQNWHQIMRKQKCRLMKEDVQNMKNQMERVLDLKNNTIKRLIKELDEAEDQYGNNFQSHLNHITDMIDFGYKSLEEMHETYDRDREEILDEARKERQVLLKQALEERTYLKTLIHQKGESSKKELRENYEHYFKKSDDVIRQNKEEFESMRQQKESMIGDLWRKIANFLRAHVEATDVKRAHLAELQSLDAESAAEIAKNEEIIKRQEEEIEILEQQFEDLKKTRSEEIKQLTETAKKVKREHLEGKIHLKKELDCDERRIIFLTSTSNETIKYLETLKDKGEKLLQLMQVCRKYETQEEKILRFSGGEDFDKYVDVNENGDDGNGGDGKSNGGGGGGVNGTSSGGNGDKGKSFDDDNSNDRGNDTINVLLESENEICESSGEESQNFHTIRDRKISLKMQSSEDKSLLTTQQSLEVIDLQFSEDVKIINKSSEIFDNKQQFDPSSENVNQLAQPISIIKIDDEAKAHSSLDQSSSNSSKISKTLSEIKAEPKSFKSETISDESLHKLSHPTPVILEDSLRKIDDEDKAKSSPSSLDHSSSNSSKLSRRFSEIKAKPENIKSATISEESLYKFSQPTSVITDGELRKIDDEGKVRSSPPSLDKSSSSNSKMSRRFSEIKAELEKHLSREESALEALESSLKSKLELRKNNSLNDDEIHLSEKTSQLKQTGGPNDDKVDEIHEGERFNDNKNDLINQLKQTEEFIDDNNINQLKQAEKLSDDKTDLSGKTNQLKQAEEPNDGKTDLSGIPNQLKQGCKDDTIDLREGTDELKQEEGFNNDKNNLSEKTNQLKQSGGSGRLNQRWKRTISLSTLQIHADQHKRLTNRLKYFRNSSAPTLPVFIDVEGSKSEILSKYFKQSTTNDKISKSQSSIANQTIENEELINLKDSKTVLFCSDTNYKNSLAVSKRIAFQRSLTSPKKTLVLSEDSVEDSRRSSASSDNFIPQRLTISSNNSKINNVNSKRSISSNSKHQYEAVEFKSFKNVRAQKLPVRFKTSRVEDDDLYSNDSVGFKSTTPIYIDVYKNTRLQRVCISSKITRISREEKINNVPKNNSSKVKYENTKANAMRMPLVIKGEGGSCSSASSDGCSENSKNIYGVNVYSKLSKSSQSESSTSSSRRDFITSRLSMKNSGDPSSPSSDGNSTSSKRTPRRRLSKSSKDSRPPPPLVTNRRLSKTSRGSRTSSSSLDKNPDVNVMKDCFSAVKKVEGLWNAYNKVLIDYFTMRKEWKFLLEENERLKRVMRSVLEAAVLEKVSFQLEMDNREEIIRDIHSADKVYKSYNIKVFN